jgi:hypothetical protein
LLELIWQKRAESTLFANRDTMRIVIHADAVAGQKVEIPSDSTAYFEGESGLEAVKVKAVGVQSSQVLFDPSIVFRLESMGISLIL